MKVLQTSRLSHTIAKSNHLLIASLHVVHVLDSTPLLASLCLITLTLWGLLLAEPVGRALGAQGQRATAAGGGARDRQWRFHVVLYLRGSSAVLR
jgi:hypothetical protein